jgi:hypothetical protein
MSWATCSSSGGGGTCTQAQPIPSGNSPSSQCNVGTQDCVQSGFGYPFTELMETYRFTDNASGPVPVKVTWTGTVTDPNGAPVGGLNCAGGNVYTYSIPAGGGNHPATLHPDCEVAPVAGNHYQAGFKIEWTDTRGSHVTTSKYFFFYYSPPPA